MIPFDQPDASAPARDSESNEAAARGSVTVAIDGPAPGHRAGAPWKRASVLGLIAVGSLVLLIVLLQQGVLDEGYLTGLLAPLGGWVYPLFVLFYAIMTMIWTPGMLLALVAVSLFAPVPAILLSLAGFLLGGTGSFYLSRVLGRDAMKRAIDGKASRIARLSDSFRRNALTHVMMLRILGAPNNIASYLSGAAGIPWRAYAIGTVVGILPGLVAATLLGGSVLRVLRAGSFDALWGPETVWTLVALGVAAVVGFGARLRQRQVEAQHSSAA